MENGSTNQNSNQNLNASNTANQLNSNPSAAGQSSSRPTTVQGQMLGYQQRYFPSQRLQGQGTLANQPMVQRATNQMMPSQKVVNQSPGTQSISSQQIGNQQFPNQQYVSTQQMSNPQFTEQQKMPSPV